MKRIIMMLTVAALMVAAMTVTAAGAFAAQCDSGNNPHCVTANPGGQPHGASQTTTFVHP
jgi:hypothetical protein